MSHPRRASSQRHKETGKRRESEGGQLFFFTLSTQRFFLFLTSKATLRYLNARHDSRSGNSENGSAFLSRTLCFIGRDEEIKR